MVQWRNECMGFIFFVTLIYIHVSVNLNPIRYICIFFSYSAIVLKHLSYLVGYWKRSSRVIGLQKFIQTMRAIQGALIVASSIQIILGYSQVWGLFSRYVDSRKPIMEVLCFYLRLIDSASNGLFCRFFSPLGMAPVVGLVGLGLFERGFPAVSFSI